MKSRTANQSISKRGGARVGAARKRKTDLLAGPIEQLREAIEEITPHVGPALRDLVRAVSRGSHCGRQGAHLQAAAQPRRNSGSVEPHAGQTTDKIEHSGDLTLTLDTIADIQRRVGCD
jgi:hypothetical protein